MRAAAVKTACVCARFGYKTLCVCALAVRLCEYESSGWVKPCARVCACFGLRLYERARSGCKTVCVRVYARDERKAVGLKLLLLQDLEPSFVS